MATGLESRKGSNVELLIDRQIADTCRRIRLFDAGASLLLLGSLLFAYALAFAIFDLATQGSNGGWVVAARWSAYVVFLGLAVVLAVQVLRPRCPARQPFLRRAPSRSHGSRRQEQRHQLARPARATAPARLAQIARQQGGRRPQGSRSRKCRRSQADLDQAWRIRRARARDTCAHRRPTRPILLTNATRLLALLSGATRQ